MKRKLALTACVLLTIGSAIAADQTDNNQPSLQSTPRDFSFGSGMNLSQGGGSASSFSGGFGSSASNSGGGASSFGGGFPAGPGSGPLSPPPVGGNAMAIGGGPRLF